MLPLPLQALGESQILSNILVIHVVKQFSPLPDMFQIYITLTQSTKSGGVPGLTVCLTTLTLKINQIKIKLLSHCR